MIRSVTVAVALVLVSAPSAPAHQAPSGWTYEKICCSGRDCRPISASELEATDRGWRIVRTGEVISYRLTRHSHDSDFHRCSIDGLDDTPTLCLYAPDMGL